MRELIVLSFLFSFGIGKENNVFYELADLKAKGERSLNLANQIDKNYNLELRQLFTKLSDIGIDKKVLDNDYFNYTKEIDKIILPMNDWITQTSKKMKALKVYLNQLQISDDLIDSDLRRFVPDSFVGDCDLSFPKDKPEKSINTNDIYDYQNKMNCERGGSEEFQCSSGECIDFNRTCDGAFDCWDGSDELGACEEKVGCSGCSEACVLGPKGPRCLPQCPLGFEYSIKFCPNLKPCYSLCLRKSHRSTISAKCLVHMFSNLLETTNENYRELMYSIILQYGPAIKKWEDNRSNLYEKDNIATTDKTNSFEGRFTTPSGWTPTTRHPTWHPTTRHPTWHPTTHHPTWHPTTHHPTWHPTTHHPTWHPTTHHPTWHPTTRHTTWHPTTHHPTWHPTTHHPTWQPTTSHPTWHPTTPHPTWHPTTRHTTWHPTWHPTTHHPTWHPTTHHPTWHPTTRHTTWHTTTRPTTWDPAVSDSGSNELDDSTQFAEIKHHTTKHTTPHSTTAHTKHTTRHHTTKHTTKHTTHHTTIPTSTTSTTPHTTTTSKPTTSSTTTTNTDGFHDVVL